MSSRRTGRQLLIATLVGVLVGGGLMVLTPAGAEVSSAVATNWKKIWKQELQPQADKRYYTKKKSDKRYYTKSKSNERYYAKWDSDAKYALKGSSYTKAESDGKYLPKQALIRGQYAAIGTGAMGARVGDNITFGVTLSAAPGVNYLNAGAAPTANCPGTAAAPNAAAGQLCLYEVSNTNAAVRTIVNAGTGAAGASVFGAIVHVTGTAAGETVVFGTWALRPAAIVSAP
ncbi:hypothetical protein IEZ26_00445 [Nocardioides cavernae]|uniref:Secreted protein n=1 Tax=Nocardioides cavernae TaxID=1921566 RepID=A0ABR8N4H8_9ACTN|nr:hypothetical protein [Nocardioides cavernae]MBD3923073.1 hypothetical protein [Nocardioides cavernae]MBM7512007.1 hypothetical protein [Nocardioides cavernae]